MRSTAALLALVLAAAGPQILAEGPRSNYAARFVQSLSVGPGTIGAAETLVYGNAEYGYFETADLVPSGNTFTARIVPPGYRFPLALYLKQRDANGVVHLERLPDVRFPYPLTPTEYAPPPFPVEGDLSSPFFLGNAIATVGGRKSQTLFIVNRQGEIVWLYRNQLTLDLGVTKPLGDGLYGFQTYRDGGFEVVAFDGTVVNQVSAGGAVVFHHDFIHAGGDRLLTFTLRGFDFPGSPLSILAPERYAVGKILEVDLKTGTRTELWDALDDGPMLHGPGWNQKAHDVGPVYVGPGAPARYDYDHVNSIDWSPGRGYLLSLRNFNTLVLLDDNFRLRWSLGSAPGTTMDTSGTDAEFYRQHHATFLPDGDILLFDNGRTGSRAIQIRVDDHAQTFSLVREFLPRDGLHAQKRGSAFRLANGHTVAFFPSSPKPEPSWIVEFDRHGIQVALMSIPGQAMGQGYRAIPIRTIGREVFLGWTP